MPCSSAFVKVGFLSPGIELVAVTSVLAGFASAAPSVVVVGVDSDDAAAAVGAGADFLASGMLVGTTARRSSVRFSVRALS